MEKVKILKILLALVLPALITTHAVISNNQTQILGRNTGLSLQMI